MTVMDIESPPVEEVNENGPRRPVYKQLVEELRDLIQSQASSLPIAMPTEAELVQSHGVSRQTVRRAYQELVEEGIVERVAGRGTRAVTAGRYFRSTGSIEDLLALSMEVEFEVVVGLHEVEDSEVAKLLALEFDTVAQVVLRRYRDGQVTSVTTASLPPLIGKMIREEDLDYSSTRRLGTVLALVEQRTGVQIETVRQEIKAVGASVLIASYLGLPIGSPILQVERTFYDTSQQPVQHASSFFNSDRYVYRIHLRRGR
jgi:GntR family transcriptional regulator